MNLWHLEYTSLICFWTKVPSRKQERAGRSSEDWAVHSSGKGWQQGLELQCSPRGQTAPGWTPQMMLMREIRTCWCSQDPDPFQQVDKNYTQKGFVFVNGSHVFSSGLKECRCSISWESRTKSAPWCQKNLCTRGICSLECSKDAWFWNALE